jgi:hypothetical protein
MITRYLSYDRNLRMSQEYYMGAPLETGGTALRNFSSSPAIRWLIEKRRIVKDMVILDFGAGNGRNARFLRDEGCHVYAYDPHNGYDNDGITGNGWYGVSSTLDMLDSTKFDAVLSCFVLNVVPKYIEDQIVALGQTYAPTQMHITRNKDLYKSVFSALGRCDKTVTDWYMQWTDLMKPRTNVNLYEFCDYGVQTSKGFQRDVHLRDTQGFELEHQVYGHKIFTK